MSKTLEELGYEKIECEEYVAFGNKDKEILFDKKKWNLQANSLYRMECL